VNPLHRVLAEIRERPAATSLDELGRRLGLSRDELDAVVGYGLHSGDLVVETITGCAVGSCTQCPVAPSATAGGSAPGCGRDGRRPAPVLVAIRPAVP
jgi:hypothetical protein